MIQLMIYKDCEYQKIIIYPLTRNNYDTVKLVQTTA